MAEQFNNHTLTTAGFNPLQAMLQSEERKDKMELFECPQAAVARVTLRSSYHQSFRSCKLTQLKVLQQAGTLSSQEQPPKAG